jgi:hypothetical protein
MEKYIKYKKKYTDLRKSIKNNIHGGMLNNCSSELPQKDYDLSNVSIYGMGGFGIIVRTIDNGEDIAIKLIKSVSECKSAKIESNIHNNVFCALENIRDAIHNTSCRYLHIPQPKAYKSFPQPVKINSIYPEISEASINCLYSMEFMYPINIGVNVYGNIPIQLHIARSNNDGLLPNSPYRGYFMKNIDSLQSVANKLSITIEDTFTAMGIALGCAIFMCQYNPLDFQFMFSLYKNEYKIIGFDFGKFTHFDVFDAKNMETIYNDMANSSYIGEWFNYDDTISRYLLTGMALVVKQIKNKIGFSILFDMFAKYQSSLNTYKQLLYTLIEN